MSDNTAATDVTDVIVQIAGEALRDAADAELKLVEHIADLDRKKRKATKALLALKQGRGVRLSDGDASVRVSHGGDR